MSTLDKLMMYSQTRPGLILIIGIFTLLAAAIFRTHFGPIMVGGAVLGVIIPVVAGKTYVVEPAE